MHTCLYPCFHCTTLHCTVGPTESSRKLKDSKSAPHLTKGEVGIVMHPDASQASPENSVGLSPVQKAKERVRTTNNTYFYLSNHVYMYIYI